MEVNAKAMQASPEARELPPGWRCFVSVDGSRRVFFKKSSTRQNLWDHPTLGPLPYPWILRLSTDKTLIYYFNRRTEVKTLEDPRYMAETLAKQSQNVPKDMAISAATQKWHRGLDMSKLSVAPILSYDIRSRFTTVHTIDPGTGVLGGMNGGVFVVRMNGLPSRLFVEKRFKSKQVGLAKSEIEMIHKLRHAALTAFTAAFVKPDLSDASLYVEFCDRGSLQDLIKVYANQREFTTPKPQVPEPFIWHVFLGLCDALAYLMSGRRFMGADNNNSVDRHWKPVLHRDIKPDNILLKSRSTLGSDKYFYCILSDFGLACEDSPNEPSQSSGGKLGTMSWLAPELCHKPYPRNTWEKDNFPLQQRHSGKSDVWALAACIYNLCRPNVGYVNSQSVGCGYAHIDLRCGRHDFWNWCQGTASRKDPLVVPSPYSHELSACVKYASTWEMQKRPDAVTLMRYLKDSNSKSGFTDARIPEKYRLPAWATKQHEYHSLV